MRDSQRAQRCGKCICFVVRLDPVPAIVRFPAPDPIRRFRKQGRRRTTYVPLGRLFRGALCLSARAVDLSEPVRQARADAFHLSSARKVKEVRIDLPQTPVRARRASVRLALEPDAVPRAGTDRGRCCRSA